MVWKVAEKKIEVKVICGKALKNICLLILWGITYFGNTVGCDLLDSWGENWRLIGLNMFLIQTFLTLKCLFLCTTRMRKPLWKQNGSQKFFNWGQGNIISHVQWETPGWGWGGSKIFLDFFFLCRSRRHIKLVQRIKDFLMS